METMSAGNASTGASAALHAAATNIRWTHVAPTLLMIWIITNFDKANMSIVMNHKEFLDEFALVGQQGKIGWLSSGMFLTYGLTAPLWGLAIQRWGTVRTAVASCLIWAFTCFWSGLAGSYESLLASRVALGAGEGALYPLTLAVVAQWFALRERGRATAFWWVGTMIGPMVVGPLVTTLILVIGWRWQFHAMGLLALILPLPMILFLMTDRPDQHRKVNQAEAQLIAAGALEHDQDAPGRAFAKATSPWTNYRFWLATIAVTSNSFFFWGWAIWLPTYLRTARHFSFSTSGNLTFVIYGFAVATILCMGFLSDRLYRRGLLAGTGWILAACFLMAAAFAPSPGWSVVLMICALCAQQTGISCAEMLMHSLVKAADMGKMQGVRSFVSQTISALSPAIIGYVVQKTGGYDGAFIILAAAVVLSAGCILRLAFEEL
ncbi:MAG TPA: MFS transporter [Stellaceae bacterium]|jgi:MFS family permease|nr:MFS transporter [Stellaceae bacterium]